MKVLFFNVNLYIWTFLNLDLLALFTSICFWDVKINIATLVKDIMVVSGFDPRLVFSYGFFFVKIIHLCNAKSCIQIFFICLCQVIMGFDDRKGIYIRDDSVLLLITYFGVHQSCLPRPSSFNIPVSLFFFFMNNVDDLLWNRTGWQIKTFTYSKWVFSFH